MKRFRFRLESLLAMKTRVEEEVKKELAKKNAEILAARRDQQDILGKIDYSVAEEKRQRLRSLDLRAVRLAVVYRDQLKRDSKIAQRRVDDLVQEKDRIRLRLAQARKESRVLEILKDKRHAEWKKEYKTEERNFNDDVSQTGYIRTLHLDARLDA